MTYRICRTEPFTVLGLELRTTNDEAFETIPRHWARFHRDGVLERIADRADDGLYAVYTRFEHAGVDNRGTYTLIIGARVADGAPAPAGLASVAIAASRCAVFSVATGHPEKVGECWQQIWASDDLAKTYLCDFERYAADGRIEIFVGIR
jgi:predicted transcriptional regulator YdeE